MLTKMAPSLLVTHLLDVLPIIGTIRRRRALIDVEAISLLRSSPDAESAYQTARNLMRLAREQGDKKATSLYAKVAVRIAALSGRKIGPVDHGEHRYGEATRQIDGERTRSGENVLPARVMNSIHTQSSLTFNLRCFNAWVLWIEASMNKRSIDFRTGGQPLERADFENELPQAVHALVERHGLAGSKAALYRRIAECRSSGSREAEEMADMWEMFLDTIQSLRTH